MSGRVTMEAQGGPDPDVVLIPYGEEIPASHVYICIMVTDEDEALYEKTFLCRSKHQKPLPRPPFSYAYCERHRGGDAGF